MLQTIVIPEKAASDDLIAWHVLQEAKLKSVSLWSDETKIS